MIEDLFLKINDRLISGWTDVRVNRGIERLPSDFTVGMTERYPGEARIYAVRPGEPCEVSLGGDLVITGYVDRYMPSLEAGHHSATIMGRGKCEDLVDCAAIWKGGQFANADVLSIASKLANAYQIKVRSLSGNGLIVPQYNINWGSTVFEIIELLCRWSEMLVYDAPDGALVLSRVGSDRHSTGLVQGKNVQRASAVFSMDQRYSEYVVRQFGVDYYSDLGIGTDILSSYRDPGVPRTRAHYIMIENGDNGTIAQQRGAWEAARRYGRGNQLRVEVDSWRDGAGRLWEPNWLVDVDIPDIRSDASSSWVIASVCYVRDRQGSRAELVLMPPQAFQPQPVLPPWEQAIRELATPQ